MAVIDVLESWESGAGWTHSGQPGSGKSTANRKFTITATPDTLNPDVLIDNRLPQPGAPHPWNAVFRCRGTTVKRTGPISFEATSKYDLATALDSDNEPDENSPLNEPAEIRFSTLKTEGGIDEDVDGMPIVTKNNEPIENATKPFSDGAITITRNIELFDFVNNDRFIDTVNSAPFLGFPTGRLRLDSIEAEHVSDPGLSYWKATAVFQSRRPINTSDARAWWLRIRHEGFRVVILTSAGGIPGVIPNIVHARDKFGDYVSRPVLLDSTGQEITNPNDAEWLEFQVFQTIDFNNLGLL